MALKIHHNLKILALMILIALSATGIDWLAHQLDPSHPLAADYFSSKIIYATFLGLIWVLAFRHHHNLILKAIWISLLTSLILQLKYYMQGYDAIFVLQFAAVHFLAFLFPMIIVFRNFPELFGDSEHPEK